jgi:hypothetical protein
MALACRAKTLLPEARSPYMTRRTAVLLTSTSCINLASSAVSLRTSVAGLLKRLHPWVALKASVARRASMTSLLRPMTWPSRAASWTLAAEKFSRPCTSTALVLDRTTLLRMALRSPSAGGLPVRPPAFPLLIFPWALLKEALAPRPGLTTDTPFFLTAELASRAALVEKAAVAFVLIRSELCSSVPTAGLARHRRQIDPDMLRRIDI